MQFNGGYCCKLIVRETATYLHFIRSYYNYLLSIRQALESSESYKPKQLFK